MAEEKKYLGTAAVERLIANTRTEIEAAKKAANDYSDSLADNYDAAGTAQTKVNELANGAVKTNTEHIGTMDNLETTAKGDLVTAINEVRNAVSAGGTAAAMTMEEKTTGLGDGIAKAYVLKQGENTVGTINIPKDMVVQSGEVVVNPEGQAAGTYIKLTLANATNDVIYVNVGTLVDIYKAKASATQVQLAIDSATREISATIVAGSIGATELAANAVVTAKIADGNVTKAKLATDVQESLNQAHSHINGHELDLIEQGDVDYWNSLEGKAESYTDGQKEIIFEYVNGKLADKADKGTTLADYGITDAYTEGQVDSEITAAKQAAIDHATSLNTTMDTRVKALEDKDSPTRTEWTEELAAIEQNMTNLSAGIESATSPLASRITELEKVDHDHTNKTQLDTYDKTQAELLAAAKAEVTAAYNDLSTVDEGFSNRIKALEDNNSPTGEQFSNAMTDLESTTDAHENRLDALESVTYTEITASEIDAMFASTT